MLLPPGVSTLSVPRADSIRRVVTSSGRCLSDPHGSFLVLRDRSWTGWIRLPPHVLDRLLEGADSDVVLLEEVVDKVPVSCVLFQDRVDHVFHALDPTLL